jgi:ribosomal protein S12 methylthiotransferase
MSRSSLPVIAPPNAAPKRPRRQVSAGPDPKENPGGQEKVLVVTLGCAKNQVDSEVLLGSLTARGLTPTTVPEEADVILVNTCAFLQSAVQEGLDRILELAAFKKHGRCRTLIVAGCLVERYREELKRALPEVDRFLSTDELLCTGELGKTSAETFSPSRRPYFLYDEQMSRVRNPHDPAAYIKIADGCDRPCAFCIIPKLRGSYRSRVVSSVVSEVSRLLGSGVREVNLVAQDLTAYGSDRSSAQLPKLPELLAALTDLQPAFGNFWLRLLYAFPTGVTDDLLAIIRDSPVVCKYLDLPLQHISDRLLHSMHRPLGETLTRKLVEKIKTSVPSIALRTTFLVGFPGETEEDIALLESFVAEGHFTHLGAFPYSPETEAESYRFPNQVPDEEKEQRLSRIMTCQQNLVLSRYQQLIGSKIPVLIEGAHQETDLLLSGRTEWQAPETDGEVIINEIADGLVFDDADSSPQLALRGKFGEVEITSVAGYDLIGRLLGIER